MDFQSGLLYYRSVREYGDRALSWLLPLGIACLIAYGWTPFWVTAALFAAFAALIPLAAIAAWENMQRNGPGTVVKRLLAAWLTAGAIYLAAGKLIGRL
jgi:hypothetical protein